jgi:PAS domain S-box-containing protein
MNSIEGNNKNKIKETINKLHKICDLSNYELFEILEHINEGVYVTGEDTRLVYMNRASEKLYGFTLEEMYGKKNDEINENSELWYPSALLDVYKEKKNFTIEQKATYSGKRILTTLCPVLDENNEVEMVVCLSREKSYTVDISYSDTKSKADKDFKLNRDIVTDSPQMLAVLDNADKVAMIDTTILLTGKTGTGKNMLAKYIHDNSERKEAPFVMVNCSAIPANLIESELFGYAPYTFSGSNPKGKLGLIAAAEGGTLFLDEIGELSLELQPKILGFIQNKKYMQVGGRKEIQSDMRIITATNKDLYRESQEKRFREDLYWRLSVIEINIPELKERKGDIGLLANMFFNTYCKKFGFRKSIAPETYDTLCNYNWPGNVRQLKNYMEKLAVTVDSDIVYPKDVAFLERRTKIHNKEESAVRKKDELDEKNDFDGRISLEEKKTELERRIVVESFAKYKTCRMVAKSLQISPTKAHRLIHKYCNICE